MGGFGSMEGPGQNLMARGLTPEEAASFQMNQLISSLALRGWPDQPFDFRGGQSTGMPTGGTQFFGGEGNTFRASDAGWWLQAERAKMLDKFRGFLEGQFTKAGGIGDIQERLAGQIGLTDEGGIVPNIVTRAFAPFYKKGRQRIIDEGTKRGLLSARGGRSGEMDRVFAEFQAEMGAREAAMTTDIAKTQSGILSESLRSRQGLLPYLQTMTGAEMENLETSFRMQERAFAKQLQRLGVARSGQFTAPAGGFTSTEPVFPALLGFAGLPAAAIAGQWASNYFKPTTGTPTGIWGV